MLQLIILPLSEPTFQKLLLPPVLIHLLDQQCIFVRHPLGVDNDWGKVMLPVFAALPASAPRPFTRDCGPRIFPQSSDQSPELVILSHGEVPTRCSM
jgi:hypothetical protein